MGQAWSEHKQAACHEVIYYNTGQSILHTLKFGEVSVRDAIQKWIAIIETTGHKSSCK